MSETEARTTDDDVAAFIIEHRDRFGYAPSVRDIAEHFGVARGTAEARLARMVRDGKLSRTRGVSRSITVMKWTDHV
jgi:DNA-binding GntR family transcriptional regulator